MTAEPDPFSGMMAEIDGLISKTWESNHQQRLLDEVSRLEPQLEQFGERHYIFITLSQEIAMSQMALLYMMRYIDSVSRSRNIPCLEVIDFLLEALKKRLVEKYGLDTNPMHPPLDV